MSSIRDDVRNLKDDARDRLAGDLESLKSNFAQLKTDVGSILSNALGAGKKGANAGIDAARGQANSAVDRVKDGYEDLRSKGNEQLESLGETIGERPVTSALIAFGVGFLVAKVMSRR